jgi:hypothetical protein
MKPLSESATDLFRKLAPVAAFALLSFSTAKAADYPTTILGDHPVAYYRLEELQGAAIAADSGPLAFDATYSYDLDTNGVPDYPVLGLPGIDTNSILFQLYTDAASVRHRGFVDIPFHPELSPVGADGQHGAPFSAECWALATTQPADYSIPLAMFGKYETGVYGNASGWNFYQSPGPNSFWILNVKNGPFSQVSELPIRLHTWYHLAVTFDGSTFVFYTNGVAARTSAGNTTYLADHGFDGQIGAGDNSGFLPFNGRVDEVAFYTNVLSAAQVLAHYQTGTNAFSTRAFPPVLLQNPVSITVNAGSPAKFTAVADGGTPLSYMWLRDGNAISGATTNPFSFITSYPADNGHGFNVIITNSFGSVTSLVANLAVQGILNLDHSPFSITRTAGTNSKAAFRVAASGSPPIYYQWFKVAGGVTNLIAGATNDTVWVSSLQLSDSGSAYYAQVTNHFVITNSDQATLTVDARSVTVPITGYARFVVADNPVAFWRLDEPTGSTVAVDAVGSFNGTYGPSATATAPVFNFQVPTGIPHETDAAVNMSGGAVVKIPYALELNPVTGPWSFETWLRPTFLDSVNFITPYSSMWNSDFGGHLFGWNVYEHPAGYWTFNAFNGGGGGSFTSDFIHHPLQTNLWYHMVITDDTTNLNYYVNDVLAVVLNVATFGFIQNGINGDPSVAGAATVLGQRSDNAFNPYIGDMDDVAVYNYALTAVQIHDHFVNNTKLTIAKSGANVILTWPVGALQASPAVTGTYTNVPNAASPFTTPLSSSPKYFRLQIQ